MIGVAGAATAAPDPVVGDDPNLAAIDQRALGGRAADVQGEDVCSPISRPSSAAAQNPLAGPDSTIVIGISFGPLEGVDAAVRLHHVQLAVEPAVVEAAGQPAEVRSATGWTYAERTAVLVRSYSRHSRVI